MTPGSPVVAPLAVAWAHDVGGSLREGFFMFWATLWPLVLGFGLSGAVQAFVPRAEMDRVMGDHRPASVARASGLGMVSSSCSYAATAMAKSLFAKGADLVSSLIFMFASTNLVVELGIVLIVLLGWQFAAAEFVGGAIMILLLAVTGGAVIGSRRSEAARRRLATERPQPSNDHDDEPSRSRLAGWADAATFTMSDLKMLRRELVVGYVVAGFLTILVPTHLWNDVFLHGHGLWTTLENVIVGPFVAVISFVCSIGNVPLAAALWSGGISFGGVISFIFADLITFPLLLVYRKYYGTALTVRLLVWFWAVMAVAGLIVQGLAVATGLVPTHRSAHIVSERFRWDATSILDIIFLVAFGALYWLYRNRQRLGAGRGYARDPVCGMQVDTATAPATTVRDGRRFWFCSDRCHERFAAEPSRPQHRRPLGARQEGEVALVHR